MKDDWNFVALYSYSSYERKQKPVGIVTFHGHEEEFETNLFNLESYGNICTYMRGKEKLVLANRDNLYIYDTKTNTRVVVNDWMIRKPHDVTEGPDDSILLSCSDHRSIIMLSDTGRIIRSYKLDTNELISKLCFSKDKSVIAVARQLPNGEAREIQLYKMA